MDSIGASQTLNSKDGVEAPVEQARAVRVVIDGIPGSLSYRVDPLIADAGTGDIVQVPLGNRAAKGWVIETLSLTDAEAELAKDIESRKEKLIGRPERTSQTSLGFLDVRKLRTVEKSFAAFHPSQLRTFRWMADYYGCPLVEVLECAVPIGSALVDRKFRPKRNSRKAKEKLESAAWALRQISRDQLSSPQVTALEKIETSISKHQFEPHLLFGVTGSGKTEVYLHAIEETLRLGGTAIVIVPEIALTPQLFDLFRNRIGDSLGLLHSQVPAAERWNTWERLLKGELRVALGARSAVFAPLTELRLIIIDEEHEASYKQADSLRYHARDIALMRAKENNATVVLGSATPSFETLLNVTKKRYSLLELPERVTRRPLPSVELVDLRKIKRKDMPAPTISPRLFQLLQETLDSKKQAIIMYNRRGFATVLQCTHCGDVLACPNCSVSLTFHRGRNRAVCHYCEHSIAAPRYCPKCRDDRLTRIERSTSESSSNEPEHGLLIQLGAGTERVVSDLGELFPNAKIAQMDRDTVSRKDGHRSILDLMRSGNADILVGTQMIAKGHDLPGVTLVGIVDADVGLHMPDFRASERAYQLLTQASGRAGRGEEAGRVVIQTREPDHPAIVATVTGRFKAFARFEMDQRKELLYPPYSRLLRIVVSSPNLSAAREVAALLPRAIEPLIKKSEEALNLKSEGAGADNISRVSVLGPAPAPQERLRGRLRFHVLVKGPSAKLLSEIANGIHRWKEAIEHKADIRITTDIDPIDML